MPAETHTHQAPLDRSAILAIVRDRLAEILEVDPDQLSETSSFRDDLGADSIALYELAEVLEDEFGERTVGFQIDDDDMEDLLTIRDTVDYVLSRLR